MNKKSVIEKQELTEELIAVLKEKVDKPLFKREICSQDFVFTYINREEYTEIQKWIDDNGANIKPSDIEDKIVDYGLVWPQINPVQWSALPAGAITTLAKHIQEKSYLDPSGYGEFDDLVVETLVDNTKPEKLTDEIRNELKKTCPHPMKSVTIGNKIYVIRPMLRKEYTDLQKLSKDLDGEVTGVNRCLMYPKNVDWENSPAGNVSILATKIMQISGFDTDNVKVEEL